MIRRDQIVIALSPTCLRVGTAQGGKLSNVNCTPLDPGEWEKAWQEDLRTLDGALQEAVRSMGIRKDTPARVIYHGPRAAAEVLSVPAEGGTALRAAAASFRERVPNQREDWPQSEKQLHRDAGNDAPRTHVLVTCDGASESNAIGGWLSRAGLATAALVPARAAALALSVRAAAALPSTGSHAVLWMGDHITALAGWNNGRLVFARAVDFGCAMLADAIFRGAQGQGAKGIDRLLASGVLMSAGIPKRGQVLDQQLGIAADSVLHLVQPIIQRYAVETRQTLRFGIPEADLARTTLHLASTGAGIPNMAAAIEPLLNVAVETFPVPASDVSQAQAGELTDLVSIGPGELNLTPPAELNRRLSNYLNSALGVGAAAAVLALAAMGAWTHGRTGNITREANALDARSTAMFEHEKLRGQADRLASDLSAAGKAVKESLGERTRWLAALSHVSRSCDGTIELNHIAGAYPADASGAPVLTLNGTAYPAKGTSAKTRSDTLPAFLDRLTKSPIVASAKIVSSHAEAGAGDTKSFVISVQLRALTPDPTSLAKADAQLQRTSQAQEEKP